jgi:exo-beta-1,3-glucanase (GH17 family)/cellulose synthase/poly-beta-1,6-N-acetylglucosamine synthase-like glycosyltransferase
MYQSKSNFLIVLVIAFLTVSLWAYSNRPAQEPPWPEIIPGFAFSPYHNGQSPLTAIHPTLEQIESDLELLSGHTHAVRTYTVDGIFAEIPGLARKHGLNIAVGAWLDKDKEKNAREIKTLLKVAVNNPRNVVRVIAGNESILRGDLSVEEMAEYLDHIRHELGVPVSTAEPYHVWLDEPELVEHVDYLAVHMLPYWEGIEVETAIGFIVQQMNALKQAYPDKPIVIGEVGWPSYGRSIKGAVASSANEAIFLRRFIDVAEQEDYTFYIMEAFDQPWKEELEGAVGAYWGVYNIDRQPKFEFHSPIVEIPQWHLLAAASVLVAVITLLVLFIDSETLSHKGRGFLGLMAFAAATLVVWIVYDYSQQYQNWLSAIVGLLLLIGVVGVMIVLLIEAHEWAEAIWVRQRRRVVEPMKTQEDVALPFVSIHVPAYNEPPSMMIETLDALSRLDYPYFEVVVVDNNTKDNAVWQPVKAHCEQLGERFRFFHVNPLKGFKAGALNYALQQTNPEAQIIAVIDSDYIVEPCWLRQLAPHFTDPEIAIVQAPQDYRDDSENAFKAMCYAEYRGFFHIGMVTRNERNAIIQHGTMTMVRRSVLEQVGNWGESTITEDAELGLRIFEHGHKAGYTPRSYGRGVMPDTFIDYKKQRYRWAFGAMQILREHAGALLGWNRTKLVAGQRYHFVAGWLPWIADGFNFIFNLAAIAWSLAMLFWPQEIDAPQIIFSAVPLIFFGFKMIKMFYLYGGAVRTSLRPAISAAIAGLALSHTIARAVMSGLIIGRKIAFYRTPKQTTKAALWRVLVDAREETFLVAILIGLIIAIVNQVGLDSHETLMWVIVLAVQAIPYACALLMSLISSLPQLPADLAGIMKKAEKSC